ncbi:hypothetical protein MIND_00136600 [Mycena indigotica]|uniref:Fungal-type protein kinase domain-containing protein n=1 Tax=Mycena indigotica TaxID=2126181 RepID=A0A8H6WEY2_9AGAR|nr:uncharacterized protein MIND_00136600 [Mycena indigotica]KAF7316184.1 hypothetical protein MIND_00136600 [Mycena indigotica]
MSGNFQIQQKRDHLKAGGALMTELDRMDFYDVECDSPNFASALTQAREKLRQEFEAIAATLSSVTGKPEGMVHYTPLAKFLNLCLTHGMNSLTKAKIISKSDSEFSYTNSKFLVYARPTADGVLKEAPLQPDIVLVPKNTGHDSAKIRVRDGIRLVWNRLDSKDIQIQIVVEVKNEWTELIRQAATYGRAAFSAFPLLTWVLAMGYNQATGKLRFLIFHRGGLTCSPPLNIFDDAGRDDCLKIIMAVLTCNTPSAHGYVEWCDGPRVRLPVSINNARQVSEYVDASIKDVLHSDTCCRGRATQVYSLTYSWPPANLTSESSPTTGTAQHWLHTAPERTPREAQTATQNPQQSGLAHSPTSNAMASDKGHGDSGSSSSAGGNQADSPEAKPSKSVFRPGLPRYPLKNLNVHSHTFTKGLDNQVKDKCVVLKATWAKDHPDWKSIEMELMNVCGNLFGCSRHHYSILPADETGAPSTNHLFLPTPEQNWDDFHWDVFHLSTPTASKTKNQKSKKIAPMPEYCSLSLHLSDLKGRSLVLCESPSSLFTSVLHVMLGWLSMFQNGFLHRDPSIGNLLALEAAEEMPPFEIDDALLKGNKSLEEIETSLTQLEPKDHDHKPQAERIRKFMQVLAVGTKSSAVAIDGDNAVKWHEFNAARNVSRSGTIEFMSPELVTVFASKKPYLHSPVDDLYAHFYVTQWAAVFHPTPKGERLEVLRNQLSTNNSKDGVKATVMTLRPAPADIRNYGGFLCKCASLFDLWDAKLRKLWPDYRAAFEEVNQIENNEELLRSLFMTYAYRGVADYMEVLAEWREANPSEV